MPVATPSQGLAVAAFVVSLLALCVPPLGLVGIFLGVVAMVNANKDPARCGGKGLAIAGISVGGASLIVGCVMLGVLLPALGAARNSARQVMSQAQMRQIGMALEMYASDNQGAFPEAGADLRQRLGTHLTGPSVWEAPGAEPGITSYFYVPIGGHDAASNPTTQALLYENPQLHRKRGGSVLYADLSVVNYDQPQYSVIIDAVTLPDGTPWTPHLNNSGP